MGASRQQALSAARTPPAGRQAPSRAWRASLAGYVHSAIELPGWRIAAAVGLALAAALAEGGGMLLLLPVLQAAGLDVQVGPAGSLAGLVSRGFAAVGLRPTLTLALGAFLLASAVRVLVTRWQTVVGARIEQDVVMHLRRRLYAAVVSTEWIVLARMRASSITHVLTGEVQRAGAIAPLLVTMVAGVAVAAIYLVAAVYLSLPLTIVVLAGGLGLTALMWERTRRSHDVGRRLSRSVSILYESAVQHLGALKVAKSYGREQRNVALLDSAARDVAETAVAAARVHADARSYFDLGLVAFLCATLFVAIDIVQITTATLVVLLAVFSRLAPRLMQLRQQVQVVLDLLPSYEATVDMLERCRASPPPAMPVTAVDLHRSVRLDGVAFRYGDDAPLVLTDIDLTIERGTFAAIVGPSGAGKSTIADLLMGLLVPTRGRILVDDRLLSADVMPAWRARVGYVSQDTFLFHDTIRANLQWAHPTASESEMLEALALAAADDFVRSMPQGLDTVIGDQGVKLSGGERQRLALARAMLRRPALVILDEPTSSLDAEHEARILRALDCMRGRVTLVMIAHRLSSVRGADLIHVIDGGLLVESGSWGRLVSDPTSRLRAWSEMQTLERSDGREAGAVVSSLP